MSRRPGKIIWFALAFAAILLPQTAQAFHDQGYPCYTCHTLSPGAVRPGSKAVLNLPGNILPTIPVAPTGTNLALPLPGTNGYPITCDYCHRSPSDVPTAKMAKVGLYSKHPVDLIQTTDLNPTREITCNDCHNGGTNDLTSTSLTVRGTLGYPDHLNMVAGYNHNLTSNPPHLTQPYWGATLPGVSRANDTAFWTGVRNNTQNMTCWVCHDGAQQSPFTQLRSSVNIRTEYTATGAAAGHQIRTAVAGAMQPGAALPCYDCHDSHGSVNASLVLDSNSIYNDCTSLLAVTTYTGARPRNDRIICSKCHDTGLAATAAGARVEGLNPVDPYNSADTGPLHISAGVADNMLASVNSCLAANNGCHATPHNPVGESLGGQRCAVCHSELYNAMNAGTATGYHHVMLGDNAPVGGIYPVSPNPAANDIANRTCLICHVDHNYFSKAVNIANTRAKNLRSDITVQPGTGPADSPRRTDYDNTLARGGICTSCHENAQTKSFPGTNIRNDGVPSTALVSKTLYSGSAHNYPGVSPFIQGHFQTDNTDAAAYFQANCTKCHNDTSGKYFQDNGAGLYQFGLHASNDPAAVNNLLAPLGITPLLDNLASGFCYRCHSHGSQLSNGKTVDAKDYYNNANMDNAAESTYGVFGRTSRHPANPADQAAGRAVDCLNCHNVHATRSLTGSIVAQTDNTYAFAAFNVADNSAASITSRSNWCLTCHDGVAPVQAAGASYVPLSVRITNPSMNKNGYPTRAHWTVNGSLQAMTVKACDACHDKHGSTARRLLGQFDPADGVNKINGVAVSATVTAADNAAICNACHTPVGLNYPPTTVTLASISTQESYRDVTGYFGAGSAPAGSVIRWPGKAVWDNGVYSPHGTSAKTGPAVLGSRGVIDCNGCHDPHGTAYNYNMLTDNMAAGNYRLCFDCHGASGPAVDNVAAYYPVASGGTGAAAGPSVHTGHNIKTPLGKLPQYTALPCYDCHVTHGSRNLNTQLKSDQRWSGLGNTWGYSNASNNRRFCLGCHVTTNGLDGSGAAVAASDNVEGLSRLGVNRLRLPVTNPLVEHASASTQGCGSCHSGRNYNDNSYGPHNPATGKCDLCHESQGALSGGVASFNGAHRTHSDNTGYRFACKQCHSWTATGTPAVHKNDTAANYYAEVVFDNQATAGWLTDTGYGTPAVYEYRSLFTNPYGAAASPTYVTGVDNGTADLSQASVRWTNGTCGAVWCHSNANPVLLVQGALGVSNQYQSAAWIDNSLVGNCTGCHGGDATSGRKIGDNTAPTNGSIVHLKHINANLGCSKCHNDTVTTSNNRLVNAIDNHVNGIKNVRFSAAVGGTWDNATKSCSGTSCHGSGTPLAEWDNTATVTGCASCHQSMGAGNTDSYTGVHLTHTNNTTYKTACEACHANRSSIVGGNAIHAGGDNNAGSAQYVDIFFSDNASSQTYNARFFTGANLWASPYGAPITAPSYAAAGASAGNDAINPIVSWTAGTCTTVWCHSNANPLSATGGVRQNAYRSASWTGTQACVYCHTGQGTAAAMNTDNTYLSFAHIQHVATDNGYSMTCDDCHAQTVPNDCTTGIIATTGFDNHVNGIKSIAFSATMRTSAISQSAGTWDNANKTCSATYCHSTGIDNDVAGGFAGSLTSPRWDNISIPGCTYCHGGGANTTAPIATNAHDNHVNNAAVLGINYTCNRCHNATIRNTDNVTLFSRALHVNGIRNVAFDNAWGSYVEAGKICNNTYCHQQGNAALAGSADNLSISWDCTVNAACRRCHGSQAAGGIYAFNSVAGEPNYTSGGTGVATSNSHKKHVAAAGACKNCHRATVSGTAIDNATFASEHINDNVEVYPGPGITFTWSGAGHTCSNISCHGNNSATWGDTGLGCANCHVRTSGDLDDYGTGAAASFKNGRVAGIDNAEWMWSGHGRDAGVYDISLDNAPNLLSGATGTNKCGYCHDSAVGHDNTSNPFRLANNNWQSLDWNGNCFICHSNIVGKTAAGYDPPNDNTGAYALKTATARVGDNHYNWAPVSTINARHTTAYNGGKFCWDCHDPHGDRVSGSGNIFMIGRKVAKATDNTLGIPVGGNDNSNLRNAVFTNNVNGSDYATGSGLFQGICETCHDAGSGITHFTNTGPGTAHFTAKCTTCHLHDGGFVGMGGPDVGQYFDRKIQAPGASNYFDNSSHPLQGLTENSAALLFGGTSINCLGCHYASGPARTSDECYKCHYENTSGADASLSLARHMNKGLELATVSLNNLPSSQYTITNIAEYDAWCLQCHNAVSAISLGGVAITAKAVVPSAAFVNGRHRSYGVGCIYCHQPHGRGNAKLIRENGWNRMQAGVTPTRFTVFPTDNLTAWYGPAAGTGWGADNAANYRARMYWADNSLPYQADADDAQAYCNKMCHQARTDVSYAKDKMIKRVAATGNYLLNGPPFYRKVYLVNGVEYTIDNTNTRQHTHPTGDIIPTDNMVDYYAATAWVSGPSYYQYPGTTSSLPSSYAPGSSDLPFSTDFYIDGVRDFANAYSNLSQRIAYRFTCTTCHDPHGTTLANTPGNSGFPDLRQPSSSPSTLCLRCHK